MPEFFVNGTPVHAERGQTVMQAALAAGFFIPYFCWHPRLSVAGNCRLCVVEVEGDNGGESWMDIACNMPVSEGMRVLTDSEQVQARRRETLQFILLNHPVDCGICDKAGECTLQDYHVAYNGLPRAASVPRVHATKEYPLSSRIVLDNERCIVCSRCVRFTREVSKSGGLAIQNRGDGSLVRAAEDGAFERDAYSDNVIDLCPVGALLSVDFLHKARVWYLRPVPGVCPGCSRGCTVDLWRRRPEWKLHALDAQQNTAVARVTPREAVAEGEPPGSPWICNWARDLPRWLARPRATEPMLKGQPVDADTALAVARRLLEGAQRPVVLVSSAASNEELDALAALLRTARGSRCTAFVKSDRGPAAGEVIEDGFLITADKNPNTAGARARFGDAPVAYPAGTDLVIVWGEGVDYATLPRGVCTIRLSSWLAPENGHAEVFLPVSLQVERAGHVTNGEGVTRAFARVAASPAGVLHAADVFAAMMRQAQAGDAGAAATTMEAGT